MTEQNPLAALLACPRCDKTPLERSSRGYSCKACRVDFPSLDGIPWLFAEPDASLGEWRERLNFVLRRLEHDATSIDSELRDEDLLAPTRTRLEHLRDAYQEHARELRRLLTPLTMGGMKADYNTYLALRTRMPARQGLTTYYVNVHRDWAWGDEENEASLRSIAAALQSQQPGRMLVLGAGACRLAYDLHRELAPELTVALDINPMLMLLAQRIMGGETVSMHEFPIAPVDTDAHAVLRQLAAPAPVPDGFHLVLADATRAPFAAGAFDTVVTPWLVDIIAEDLRVFARRMNALLRSGGRWINFGSLTFAHRRQAWCYSLEEALALCREAGFGEPTVQQAEIPYMHSPASRHGRRETVMTWLAPKQEEAPRAPRHTTLPDWIVKGDAPVPLLEPFQVEAMSTRIYAFIMSLIDGKRSLQDMAGVMADQRLMTRAEAEPAIRTFLIKMYESSQERPRF